MKPEPSTFERVARAATCALVPGPCVVDAVRGAQTVASDAAATAQARAQLAATAAATGASQASQGVLGGLADVVHEAAEPVESQASAARYVAVATAVVVVALVLGAVILAFKLT